MRMTRSGSSIGSGLSSSPFAKLKMVTFEPIPTASATMAVAVKAGLRISMRHPYRTSFKNERISFLSANVFESPHPAGEGGQTQPQLRTAVLISTRKEGGWLTGGLDHWRITSRPPPEGQAGPLPCQ